MRKAREAQFEKFLIFYLSGLLQLIEKRNILHTILILYNQIVLFSANMSSDISNDVEGIRTLNVLDD